MSGKNDQVFQLSLTEIFIIICFILLLLMGYQIFKLTHKNEALHEKMLSVQDLDIRESAINKAAEALKARMTALGVRKPDEIISKLVDASKATAELDRLKVLMTQKDQELTALASIEKALMETAGQKKGDDAKQLILETMMSFDQLKKLVVAPTDDGVLQPTDVVKRVAALKAQDDMLAAAFGADATKTKDQIQDTIKHAMTLVQESKKGGSPVELQKANRDLRGQVQFLQNRLNKGRGGDLPPCWVNEVTGKAEMFLTVKLSENNLTFEPAWPPARREDAMALPGITELMATPTRTYESFTRAAKPVSDFGSQKECKYYVRLLSQIQDAVISDRRRLVVETLFYKVEIRR
ncbi:hypothetical protein HU720_00675 [Pseudomonas sp. SWRI51]|uniref:hypothetical protein n=1 Tax=Pseudomonas sp. SWRI51 TaxID=2745491 RepID=UPI0016482083|nr:hypothetical protein [Pseudomonas sp. SWRI51]MBC3409820.1 hypothetical protein [Pseudomonas sp. SWRI51]